MQVGLSMPTVKRSNCVFFHRPVDFAPPDELFASWLAHDEFVFGRAPGMMACSDNHWSVMGDSAFVATNDLLVEH